ncbi:MAG TPA: dTDP-4-dehydrorhamnose reductase [Acidimicrobiia bacterium]|nr:dTDP-4-dehydrorhamnose reductase [Acidimicrobiia bacterium]
MSQRRVLIIGAGGQLGTAFAELLPDARRVTRERLDLAEASPADLGRLLHESGASVVINCAAYTNVDQAELEEALATQVNGWAVGRLAAVAAELDIRLITYSTDYVFDGQGQRPYLESDMTDPVNAYGRSKLVGEREALVTDASILVIRTSWVLSATHRNFVTAILSRARQGQPLKVVADQRGCPTIAADLAVATLAGLEAEATGLLHLTNRGETTWFDLARTAIEAADLDSSLVSPCPTEDYPTPARRPAYSVLGSEVAPKLGLEPLPHWTSSIESVVSGSMRLIGG